MRARNKNSLTKILSHQETETTFGLNFNSCHFTLRILFLETKQKMQMKPQNKMFESYIITGELKLKLPVCGTFAVVVFRFFPSFSP